jgi:hypothetical protein
VAIDRRLITRRLARRPRRPKSGLVLLGVLALPMALNACSGGSSEAAPCTIESWFGTAARNEPTASITLTESSAQPPTIPPSTRFLWVTTPKVWESIDGNVGSTYPQIGEIGVGTRVCAVNIGESRRSLFSMGPSQLDGLQALDFSVPGVTGDVSVPFNPPTPPDTSSETTILTP